MTHGAGAVCGAAIRAGSLLLFSFLCLSAGYAAVDRSQLPTGSTLIVRRDATVPTVAIELWFRVPSTGFGNPIVGLSRYAATAIAASKSSDGMSVSQLIKGIGGRFLISAYPDAVSIAASVPAGTERRMLRALTRAYFSPILAADATRGALRDVVVAGTQERLDPEATLHDALFAQLFTSGPAHYAALPSNGAALGRVSLAELRQFAARAFRSSNAVLTVAGDAPADLSASVTAGRVDGRAMESVLDSTRAPATTTTKPYAEDAVGLAWFGPPISDARAATALDFIADYLFRADTGVVARADRAEAGDALLSGQFVTLHDPGVMLVEMAGKQLDLVRAHVEEQIERIKHPLSENDFAAARRAFEYHILSDSETPLSTADNFGWYALEGDPLYAPSDDGAKYLQSVESLDPAYVARVAQQYLGTPTVVQLKAGSK